MDEWCSADAKRHRDSVEWGLGCEDSVSLGAEFTVDDLAPCSLEDSDEDDTDIFTAEELANLLGSSLQLP